MVRELHLERLQGLWFSAGMGRDRMLVRGALIGDMTPGSVLDIIGGNVSTFQTLKARASPETYGAFRLDLGGLYATVLARDEGRPAARPGRGRQHDDRQHGDGADPACSPHG